MRQDPTHAPPPAGGAGVDTHDPSTDVGDTTAARLSECEAQLASVLKDQALVSYGIAHDLRAPLRAIEGFSAMLESGSGEALDATGRDYLARIRAAAARMASLLDALQALSRASHDHLTVADVDASLLADWALMELRDADPGRLVEASVQPGMRARADERQLKLLFDHLLHNAWKFSGARDAVRIAITAERHGDRVRIHVRDQGSGFDTSHAGRVFEPFQRVHGPDEGGGHGLGLAIAQRIATRLGGGLGVDSEPGRGSVFHVELPAAQDARP
ncbi:sensor histidine kinase [Luteimonas changyuni]|uniref:sensor histidine kinase n=1 Tax=Luteimonas sp. MJ145 TaxID=3129234 RepID=UPI0031BAE187